MKLLIIVFLIAFSAAGQVHRIDAGCNISTIQLSSELSYRYVLKNWDFAVHLGFGQIGRKKDAVPLKDGYNGAYNVFDFSGNYQDFGYQHNFIGFKYGAGFGRIVNINENNKLVPSLNLLFYNLADHYTHSYSSNITKGIIVDEKHKIKYRTSSVSFALNYYFSLNVRSGLKLGLEIPFIFPNNHSKYFYQSIDFKQPVSGWEPFIKVGYQYIFQKK